MEGDGWKERKGKRQLDIKKKSSIRCKTWVSTDGCTRKSKVTYLTDQELFCNIKYKNLTCRDRYFPKRQDENTMIPTNNVVCYILYLYKSKLNMEIYIYLR
jgi:hypothetical protein